MSAAQGERLLLVEADISPNGADSRFGPISDINGPVLLRCTALRALGSFCRIHLSEDGNTIIAALCIMLIRAVGTALHIIGRAIVRRPEFILGGAANDPELSLPHRDAVLADRSA